MTEGVLEQVASLRLTWPGYRRLAAAVILAAWRDWICPHTDREDACFIHFYGPFRTCADCRADSERFFSLEGDEGFRFWVDVLGLDAEKALRRLRARRDEILVSRDEVNEGESEAVGDGLG